MDQSTVTLLTGLVGLMSTFILTVLQIKKADRERYEKTRADWGEVQHLQKEHIDVLEMTVTDLQKELTGALERLARIQARSDLWNHRNAELYEALQTARSRLSQLGQDPGPEPNGTG